MARAAKVTVAGSGALGLCAALALAEAGCAVTVCDPAPEGANASGVAAGMLAPAFEAVLDGAALDVLLAARDLWPGLEARAGVRLDRAGAAAAGSAAWLAEVRAGFVRQGLHLAEAPAAALGGLAADLPFALLTREDWRLEPRRALAALRAAAAAKGVEFRSEAVCGRGDADWLVVATGPAAGLAPELSRLTPIKGHILRVAGVAPAVSLRGERGYVVPCDGGAAVGATMEMGVGDPAVDAAQEAPLRAAGATLLPAVAQAPGELFAGVRAATPDGLPLAGMSAEPRVVLATGARRNGWLLAPLVAKIVAACVTGGDLGPYAARLDPGRFARGAA